MIGIVISVILLVIITCFALILVEMQRLDIITAFIVSILGVKTIIDIIFFTGLSSLFPETIRRTIDYLYRDFYHRVANAVISALRGDDKIGIVKLDKEKELSEKCISPLTSLLSRYTFVFPREVKYGEDRTRYYINTLGASLSERDLRIMTWYILNLVSKKLQEIDFVVSPKTGNVLLGYSVAKELDALFLIVKSTEERSRVKGVNNEEILTEINIEGSNFLLEKVKNLEGSADNKALKGIIVDCNFSGGTQILTCYKELKRVLDSKGVSKKRVELKNVFTLFKVDSSPINSELQRLVDSGSLYIYRYFDLDEKAKEILYQIKENNSTLSAFINHLRETNKLSEKELSIFSC